MIKIATLFTALVGLTVTNLTPAFAADHGKTLDALADGAHRSAENKSRNVYRHPVETLTFFGLEPDMTVVEISPGGGWYTEIIAPYVNDDGQYYGAGFDRDTDVGYYQRANKALDDKLASDNSLYGNAIVTELSPPDKTTIAPAGSADMVLTFRNMHNWMRGGTAEGVFKAVFDALKPGGIFGIVEHRGNSANAQDPKAVSGYVNEDIAVDMIEEAGFVLVERSEINANAKDTKDHPKGVWTLPPSLRQGDVDRDKYLAIGESDRFTLKFIKPKE